MGNSDKRSVAFKFSHRVRHVTLRSSSFAAIFAATLSHARSMVILFVHYYDERCQNNDMRSACPKQLSTKEGDCRIKVGDCANIS